MRSFKLLVAVAMVTALVAGPVLAQDSMSSTGSSTSMSSDSTTTTKTTKTKKHSGHKKHKKGTGTSTGAMPSTTTGQ